MRGSVVVQLTNGFGNNIFQIVAARLLAEKHERELFVLLPWKGYYGYEELDRVIIGDLRVAEGLPSKQIALVNDDNYAFAMKQDKLPECCLLVRGHFEDYRYFIEHRGLIKTWFTPVSKKEDQDLIFHFRTGDRLFAKNEFEHKPTTQRYKSAIESFDFNRLHIVSDLPELKHYAAEELGSLKFHNSLGASKSVKHEDAAKYLNNVVSFLSGYQPVFRSASISEDFNKIRSFNNIMFEHGTMSWWAAFLTDASKVGVRKDWRPWKGRSNKNLSELPVDGWFGW